MPLKRMLNDSRAFEPKAVALLLETFDEIVADLDLRIDADREGRKNRHEACSWSEETRRSKDPRRSRPLDAKGRQGT